MKKIIATFLLILPLAVIAEDFGTKIPEWKDFAPSTFVDVQAPGKLSKFNVVANYWYQRRVEFEAGLEECQALEANDERYNCYENLKVKQYKANTDYNARVEAQMKNTSGIPEMSSKTDTMLPINGYLNNFAKFQQNEIR
jgi:hypothetical protein